MSMKPEEYPTAHNIKAGNVNAAINHLRLIAYQMTVSANLSRTSGDGEQAAMTTKAVETVAYAVDIGLSDLIDRTRDLRKEFETILSPAIDTKAPYAKVMLSKLVAAAFGK